MNADNLRILSEINECTLCFKPFKHRKRYWINPDTPVGLKEVELITAHLKCRCLEKKRNDLLDQLSDVEAKIFQLCF